MDLASRLGGLPNPARSNTGYLRMRLAPSLACVARIRKWHRTANESGAAAIFFVIRAFRALLHTRHAIAVLQVQRVFRARKRNFRHPFYADWRAFTNLRPVPGAGLRPVDSGRRFSLPA